MPDQVRGAGRLEEMQLEDQLEWLVCDSPVCDWLALFDMSCLSIVESGCREIAWVEGVVEVEWIDWIRLWCSRCDCERVWIGGELDELDRRKAGTVGKGSMQLECRWDTAVVEGRRKEEDSMEVIDVREVVV